MRCAGRIQGNGCTEPSCYASVVEDQIGVLLTAFAVPEDERSRMLTAWRRHQSAAVDTVAERIRIRRKLDRLKDLYLEGDLDKAAYQAQKARLTEDLASLPPEGNPDSDVGERLATFLSDVAKAWTVATPEERNRLARQLFGTVVVTNRTAVAVVPRPDLRPFFACVAPQGAVKSGNEVCYGGSDGGRFRGCLLPPDTLLCAGIWDRCWRGHSD